MPEWMTERRFSEAKDEVVTEVTAAVAEMLIDTRETLVDALMRRFDGAGSSALLAEVVVARHAYRHADEELRRGGSIDVARSLLARVDVALRRVESALVASSP